MAEKKKVAKKNGDAADRQLAERSGEGNGGAGEFSFPSKGGDELNSLSKRGDGLDSLRSDGTRELTSLSHASETTTVSLSATANVAEGGTITYTASVGEYPVLSPVTVALTNGLTISILPGQTSGAVTMAAPADVYAGITAVQTYAGAAGVATAAIASVAGDGGFERLVISTEVVRTTVSDVIDVTTVTLSATAVVAEGGTITYTASLGAHPALSPVTVRLDNGHSITIAAGQTSGAVTVAAPADVYAGTPGAQVAAIDHLAGSGGFERLVFNPAPVSTAVSSGDRYHHGEPERRDRGV